jgi:two-component system chemotaxis response regulator CheB
VSASAHGSGRQGAGPIIGLVASAGGLDAVSRVLDKLPAPFVAGVVVLIHQEPDRESALVQLLARRCAIPVAWAQDDEPLTPGRVAVVPPGRHLLITAQARTLLIASGAAPPSRPSADLLLATLATAAGPRAIAVVLSGAGHDGATGATAIHACGGTVVATDEASSQVFSMPRATIERRGVIDRIVALEDVGELLAALVAAPA